MTDFCSHLVWDVHPFLSFLVFPLINRWCYHVRKNHFIRYITRHLKSSWALSLFQFVIMKEQKEVCLMFILFFFIFSSSYSFATAGHLPYPQQVGVTPRVERDTFFFFFCDKGRNRWGEQHLLCVCLLLFPSKKNLFFFLYFKDQHTKIYIKWKNKDESRGWCFWWVSRKF